MKSIDPLFLRDNLSILPEFSRISGLVTIAIADLVSKGRDTPLLHRISLTSLVISIVLSLCQWQTKTVSIFYGSIQINTFSNIFRLLLLICPLLSVPLSVDYVRCAKIALTEFSLFISTAGLGGMFSCRADDSITIFVALECLSLSSYLLSGYTKRDIRSNEATMKFLLMGGANSAILAYGFSPPYGLSGGKFQLDEIVDGLVSTQMYNSIGIYISITCIVVGMGFKPSLVPFHQWTPDVYEGFHAWFWMSGEANDILSDSDSPTPVVAFFSVASKVAAPASSTRLFGITFSYPSDEWHIASGILAISSMILGNLIAVTQTSMKRMLAYSSTSQIGYIMIGILAADPDNGYASMTTYTFIHIFMNLGTSSCITLFGLRSRKSHYCSIWCRAPPAPSTSSRYTGWGSSPLRCSI
uniref:NADH-plastoquinone oxidoreductase subunit 2 n=1 Tax=Dipteris conjugata TaxID=32108 RepID=A0A0B5EEE5_9MONI|nr:NADH-plastoquinone oxidoreductase subunit 2 [Dipteris conjugata]